MASAENLLKKRILDYLGALGHTVWNTNVGRTRGYYKTGIPGASDIQGYHCKTGIAIFIEAKIPPNQLTPDQIVFLFNAAQAGCIAFKASSMEDVLNERRLE